MAENETLSRRQKRALAALLSEPTTKAAAEKAGISRTTLYRYLAEPCFQEALAQQQRQVLRASAARLAALLERALDVLGETMASDEADSRLKAAALVVRHVARLTELAELQERVEILETRAVRAEDLSDDELAAIASRGAPWCGASSLQSGLC